MSGLSAVSCRLTVASMSAENKFNRRHNPLTADS